MKELAAVTLAVGTKLGRYKVRTQIGAGGMGEVYLAEDTRLGRKVALKRLPDDLIADEPARRRFDQEAKTTSALNDPHIVTIYDIVSHEHHDFIAMEYVEGESLRARLEREKVSVKQAVEFAAQVASGLARAHSRGIIHRDIKPENLMVTPASQIKILDFGLAKLVEKRGASIASDVTTAYLAVPNETKAGSIPGTVPYMSPEQAEGRELDHRTDIFSLGLVLYEMLTGRKAFQGKSTIDTLHAIVNSEPPLVTKINPQVPAELTDILAKALAKDSAERYQHVGDFELDLRRFKRALETNSLLSSQPSRHVVAPKRGGSLMLWSIVGIVFVLGLVIAAWVGRSSIRPNPDGWSTSRTVATQLTNYGCAEASAALSPDGRSFVFVSEHGGTPDLWRRQVAGGEPVPLTHDAAEEADPIFAPDGETIYFTRIDDIGPSIWRIGALGGQARRIVSNARKAAPSPDGRSLTYFTPDSDGTGDKLVLTGLEGIGTRTLAGNFSGGVLNDRAVWSPDGRSLVYSRWELFAPSNLFVLEVSTGQERKVTQFTHSGEGVQSQAWLPDSRHIVISYTPETSSFFQSDLGVLDTRDGSISRLTFNVAQLFGSLSVSADGSRLIATANQIQREVSKVPLGPDPEANGRAAVRVLDSSQDPMWTFVSRDGKTLLFNNATTGTRNLWTMPVDHSAAPRQITMIDGDNVMHSSLSPDGSRVAFVSRAKGSSDIWTQNIDGSDLRQLTNDEAAVAWPVWSPDGKWIVYASLHGRQWETWRVALAGGPAEKIIDGFFRGDLIRQPNGSGTWLVSSLVVSGIRLIDFDRQQVLWEDRFQDADVSLPMFSPDGRFISVPRHETRDRDAIWIYETATGKGRLAVKFAEPVKIFFRACWVDDGKALVFNRYQSISHIVLFDKFWMRESTP